MWVHVHAIRRPQDAPLFPFTWTRTAGWESRPIGQRPVVYTSADTNQSAGGAASPRPPLPVLCMSHCPQRAEPHSPSTSLHTASSWHGVGLLGGTTATCKTAATCPQQPPAEPQQHTQAHTLDRRPQQAAGSANGRPSSSRLYGRWVARTAVRSISRTYALAHSPPLPVAAPLAPRFQLRLLQGGAQRFVV